MGEGLSQPSELASTLWERACARPQAENGGETRPKAEEGKGANVSVCVHDIVFKLLKKCAPKARDFF